MLAGAERVLARAKEKFDAEDTAMKEALAQVIRDHTVLPPNYYQNRHIAEQHLRSAKLVIEAIREVQPKP